MQWIKLHLFTASLLAPIDQSQKGSLFQSDDSGRRAILAAALAAVNHRKAQGIGYLQDLRPEMLGFDVNSK